MIYLLVEDAQGYDDCDRHLFAHSDKEVVELVRQELVKRHERLYPIGVKLQEDMEKVWDAHRPLSEDNKKLREQVDEISKLQDEVIEDYGRQYNLSKSDMDALFHHYRSVTYSIEEIEADPDQFLKDYHD